MSAFPRSRVFRFLDRQTVQEPATLPSMDTQKQKPPFRLLSDEEFAALNTLERVEYLMRAIDVQAVIERQVKEYLASADSKKKGEH